MSESVCLGIMSFVMRLNQKRLSLNCDCKVKPPSSHSFFMEILIMRKLLTEIVFILTAAQSHDEIRHGEPETIYDFGTGKLKYRIVRCIIK